jgi:hypothetical protein
MHCQYGYWNKKMLKYILAAKECTSTCPVNTATTFHYWTAS